MINNPFISLSMMINQPVLVTHSLVLPMDHVVHSLVSDLLKMANSEKTIVPFSWRDNAVLKLKTSKLVLSSSNSKWRQLLVQPSASDVKRYHLIRAIFDPERHDYE